MIGNARVALLQMKKIWKSNVFLLKNKITIFNTNVKAVLSFTEKSLEGPPTVTTSKRI